MDQNILAEQIRITRLLLLENRIEFLKAKFAPAIAAYLAKDELTKNEIRTIGTFLIHNGWASGSRKDTDMFVEIDGKMVFKPDAFFSFVSSYDPSKTKLYTQWLITLVVKYDTKIEDLYKATQYLEVFDRVKNRLPTEQRDILKYRSLNDLFDVIEPLKNTMTKNEEDRMKRSEMFKQCIVRMNTPDYLIVTPLTYEASCYFGVNTEWCTANSTTPNSFKSYSSRGPLYIILDKKNNKRWQFHLADQHFMNENDRPIDLRQFKAEHPEVYAYFESLSSDDNYTWVKEIDGNKWGWDENTGTLTQITGEGLLARSGQTFKGVYDDGKWYLHSFSDMHEHLSGMVELFNAVPFAGPNFYDFIERDHIAYDEKTGKWGDVLDFAKTLTQNGLFEKWMNFSGDFAVDNGGIGPDTEEFSFYYHVGPNGEIDWELEQQGSKLKTLYFDIKAVDTEKRNMVAISHDLHRNEEGKIIGATPRYSPNLKTSYNDSSIMHRHMAIAFAELTPYLPSNVKYERHIEKFDPMEFMPKELKETIIKNRPNLCRPTDLFDVYGDTEITRDAVLEFFMQNDVLDDGTWAPQGLVVYDDNIKHWIIGYGGSHAEWVYNQLTRDNFIDYDSDADKDTIRELLGNLEKKSITAIGLYLQDNYPEQVEDIDEYDPSDEDHVFDLFEMADDHELRMLFDSAYRVGREAGAYNEMYKAMISYLNSIPNAYFGDNNDPSEYSGEIDDKFNIDDGNIAIIMPTKKMIEYSESPDDLATFRYNGFMNSMEYEEMDSPYYGYDEYDDKAAVDDLRDRLSEVISDEDFAAAEQFLKK